MRMNGVRRGFFLMGWLIAGAQLAGAQPIVINEFRNATPDVVELVVISDALNVQGYIIKDFSNNGNSDGGRAFTFAANALWASLPSGTIIVLRNDTSSADVTVGSGDYNLDVGLQNTNFFILGSGTFDIATDDIIMIKTNGSATAGISGSLHAFGTDFSISGTNFAAIATPKLLPPSGGDTPAGTSIEATTPTPALADYNGTNALGDNATGTIGTWNNANNQTYILSLRAIIPTNTAPIISATSPHIVQENGSLTFPVVATDLTDNDVITLLASNLPPGAVFNPVINATTASNSFVWASAAPAGVYTTTFYAADNDGTSSTSVVITVQGAQPNGPVWINEMEYLGASAEYVEVAGPAGTDLATYRLLLYNGSGGAVYDTIILSGTIDNEGCGVGAVSFAASGMQNGSPDGVALVHIESGVTSVIQFLSYEGSFTAVGGAANGMLSVNVGDQLVATNSLQLVGSGTNYTAFTWATNAPSSGSLNVGQTITPCVAPGVLLRFALASDSASESGGPYQVVVIKTEPVSNVTAEIQLSGTAALGVDYTLNTTNIVLNGATTQQTISVTVSSDLDFEADETIVMTLVNPVQASLTAPSVHTFTIIDDDEPVLPNAPIWINEFNYDDPGADSNEFVEVAGPAGTDLSAYTLLFFDGGGGASYGSLALSGVIDDEGCGFGAVTFSAPGLQNGPDGIAIVSNGTTVIQFISYEGTFEATNGLNATEVGSDLGAGSDSLQLGGSGDAYAEYAWQTNTFSQGALNINQTITPCGGGGPTIDEYDIENITVAPGNVSVTVNITSNGVPYSLLFTTNLLTAPMPTGTADTEVATGGPVTLQDSSTTQPYKFYWIKTND